jgi:two-component system, cell cycle sensor histidine kinase and response regulator CckA
MNSMLRNAGLEVATTRVFSEAGFHQALQNEPYDVVISDYSLPSYSGRAALQAARNLRPEVPFIFYSGTIGEEGAIEALKLGAVDYVLKQNPKRLVSALQRALEDSATARREEQAEQRTREQAQLLDLATDAIIAGDMQDRVVYWNRAAESLYGYKSEEAIGTALSQLLSQAQGLFAEARSQTMRLGHWEGEIEQKTKTGRSLCVMSRWTLAKNPAGEPQRILWINSDITDKKKAEKQLIRTQRLESVGTLASGIAHDLNNILAPILMASDLLSAEASSQNGVAMIQLIRTSVERGADILKQLLTFVRGTDGKRVPVDFGETTSQLVKVLRETFPRNISIRYEIENNIPKVMGDPTQLYQVLMNLCINSRDAMPEGGNLVIRVKGSGGSAEAVRIEVQDSGIGIPAELTEQVFDPFFTTKEPSKGTGLGLSIALGIVKSHGGTMTVESSPGRGTQFDIVIPALTQAFSAAETERSARRPTRGSGELILIVDDEMSIRELVAQTCVQNGYQVMTARDGTDALAQFRQEGSRISAVVTDLMMPKTGGLKLAQTLRSIQPSIKIIAMSGAPGESALSCADLLIPKPFDSRCLLNALQSILAAENGNGHPTQLHHAMAS